MWQIKDEINCEIKNLKIWGKLWVHHEADKNIKTQEPDEFMVAYISTYLLWKTSNEYLSPFGVLGVHMAIGLIQKLCSFDPKNKKEWVNLYKADERVEGEGYEMNNEWHTEQAGSKFQGVSPVEFFLNIFQDCIQPRDALLGETAWH